MGNLIRVGHVCLKKLMAITMQQSHSFFRQGKIGIIVDRNSGALLRTFNGRCPANATGSAGYQNYGWFSHNQVSGFELKLLYGINHSIG
jgi:hypothetical protein